MPRSHQNDLFGKTGVLSPPEGDSKPETVAVEIRSTVDEADRITPTRRRYSKSSSEEKRPAQSLEGERAVAAKQPGPSGSSDRPPLMKVKEVADLCSVSVQTIWRWTSENDDFPKPAKIAAGCTRWSRIEVEAFIKARFDERAQSVRPVSVR